MRFRRFGPLTLVSCAAWTLVLVGSGYFFSGAIEVIIGEVKRIGLLLLLGFALACAIALAFYLIERYVIARRVPEMEPPLLHETLQEKLHETLHETRETEYKTHKKSN
jgi:hypothetical protein